MLVIFLPPLALAQDFSFSVSPTEVEIDAFLPGDATEFDLTIRNKDEVPRIFTLTAFHPPQEQRRKGRAEFPDDSWIAFSPREIELRAKSEANVTVAVAIPPGQEWAGYDWEIWLGVAAESDDLLAVELYVRLLVSTSAPAEPVSHLALVAGIVAGIILLGYGAYYYFFRRKAKPL